jgi:5-hydroxyisourate hydrolase
VAGKLTTHVLDTSVGKPAADMRVELLRLENGAAARTGRSVTNSDGRLPQPLLTGDAVQAATYQIVFHVGEYFAARGNPDARRFLDVVPIVFVIDDPTASYHVPLLVSPWSYSTYRGS